MIPLTRSIDARIACMCAHLHVSMCCVSSFKKIYTPEFQNTSSKSTGMKWRKEERRREENKNKKKTTNLFNSE